ncbi:hypothetical protein ACSBR1_040792 [Camellia fascicularis]
MTHYLFGNEIESGRVELQSYSDESSLGWETESKKSQTSKKSQSYSVKVQLQFLQGPNKKILCQLSMLERRMAQGHYLSASAQMWASTHSDSLKEKMSAVVSALSASQDKMGTGYLSTFPSEQFDRFEAIKPVWAPYYTIHKIMAGLLDQYILAENAQALKMLTWMVDYFYNRVLNVITKYSVERHYLSLNEETGGMNDVLYKLYAVTGDWRHLLLAHLFDKPCFLGLLAVKADDISGFHANTHIPVVIGSQMRYECYSAPH